MEITSTAHTYHEWKKLAAAPLNFTTDLFLDQSWVTLRKADDEHGALFALRPEDLPALERVVELLRAR